MTLESKLTETFNMTTLHISDGTQKCCILYRFVEHCKAYPGPGPVFPDALANACCLNKYIRSELRLRCTCLA